MTEFGGWFLPDGEKHLVDWMKAVGDVVDGRYAYQHKKLVAALGYVKQFRHAVDVGAHCGLWSFYLAPKFERVTCFEPVAAHRECWLKNITAPNANLCHYALGDRDAQVTLHTGESSSGDTYIKEGGEHPAEMRTLDSLGLTDIDFVKIDAEGFERFILLGAEQTIRRDKPCIIVEQKPGKGKQFGLGDTDAVTLLQSWGATVRDVMSGDFIVSW